ncbi:hypothetical protein GGD81_004599 [Rhodobium orientis]|uniref:Nucleoside-diphosphate sugar epimerase n=1 Tax=Rhodobium orientis TaxID=34017 RepID=A0A327JCU0_9HYPH|nr:mitochondrial fission ELM1 family protein [Rhodobium orientis]MBB4305519.1 hypothetical protein [Rhodobium orientis]MBK5949116.1 hypothetical protein [Rhodobium orientis]RAI23856.1 hypothetical protein CH339_23080 [Rhodobium orientis]
MNIAETLPRIEPRHDFSNLSAWIIDNGAVGDVKQCRGIANALNLTDVELIPLQLPHPPKLVRRMFPGIGCRVPPPPYPDIVFSSGSDAAFATRLIKQASPATVAVHLAKTHVPADAFDVVVTPLHMIEDHAGCASGKVLPIFGVPNNITPELLAQERAAWAPVLDQLPKPRLAVLVGGSAGGFRFRPRQVQAFSHNLIGFASLRHYSLMVSTSRRTGEARHEAILNNLELVGMQTHWYDGAADVHDGIRLPYDVLNLSGNPLVAFLATADAIVVTADSLTMTSEACATDKPVYVWGRYEANKPERFGVHVRFQETLRLLGRTSFLVDNDPAPPPNLTPLDETARVAAHVAKQLRARAAGAVA